MLSELTSFGEYNNYKEISIGKDGSNT